jgi:surfactin synthase thioesterase subunit
MDDLIGDLARSIQPYLDRPYTIFGHSMGALVGFELTRRLRALGAPGPEHLIVSAACDPAGRQAPERPLHLASDALVMAKLRSLNGTPAVLLEDDEFMGLMLPTIRADFEVLETYRYRVEDPLEVPITVLGGTKDTTVSRLGLTAWSRLSTRGFGLRMFDGDHFYLHHFGPELVGLVTERVTEAVHA